MNMNMRRKKKKLIIIDKKGKDMKKYNIMTTVCMVVSILFAGCGCVKTGEEFLQLVFDRPVAIEAADSSAHILALEVGACDYIIWDQFAKACVRQGDRKASVGTAADGMYYDGERAYRYLNGEAVPMEDFPWDRIDERMEQYLQAIQTIVQDGCFRSYNEEPDSAYFGQQFYYAVSPEGMKQIPDSQCESALIISKYREGKFQYVTLYLYTADGELFGTYDIGALDHYSAISPPQ